MPEDFAEPVGFERLDVLELVGAYAMVLSRTVNPGLSPLIEVSECFVAGNGSMRVKGSGERAGI